jgi:hypothetical protein
VSGNAGAAGGAAAGGAAAAEATPARLMAYQPGKGQSRRQRNTRQRDLSRSNLTWKQELIDRRLKRMNIAVFTALLAVLQQSAPTNATQNAGPEIHSFFAPVPFGPGERMMYTVSLGPMRDIGKGTVEVQSIDTVHGHPVYQLRMDLKGGVAFAKVDDVYKSWLDAEDLISRRFHQDIHEVKYDATRTFEFFPEERMWRRTDKDQSGQMPTDEPLDDLSFLFYARTLPLEVGRTYTLQRYWKADGNPVTLKVVRKETVTTSLGTFQTIVVQPIIRTKGLFGDGGKAEVYFTDDEQRIPVQITTHVKIIGSMTMKILRYEQGKRVSPQFKPGAVSNQ